MLSYLDCYPCLIRHALDVSRRVTDDCSIHEELLRKTLSKIQDLPRKASPVRMAAEVHGMIRDTLGNADPYEAEKKEYNSIALGRLPGLGTVLDQSSDRLETAVRIAIAGNIIDFGALSGGFDLEATLEECLHRPLDVDDYPLFREKLVTAKEMVYVGDNAGEIVFDRLLVEEIQRFFSPNITFIVRGGPILNDATFEDAVAAGLTERVRVVSSTCDGPGCELDRSEELRPLFDKADLILSKGQGNYEALSHEPYPNFFLLKVKCRIVALEIGAKKGDSVIKFRAP